MNRKIAEECTHLSDNEQITFPEVVKRLYEAGVELYYADLLTPYKTFYAQNEAYTFPCKHDEKKVSDTFNKDGVIQAIRKIQSGQIKYQPFIKEIMEAGVVAYFVFITGRKAVYIGKKGEEHVENFP